MSNSLDILYLIKFLQSILLNSIIIFVGKNSMEQFSSPVKSSQNQRVIVPSTCEQLWTANCFVNRTIAYSGVASIIGTRGQTKMLCLVYLILSYILSET